MGTHSSLYEQDAVSLIQGCPYFKEWKRGVPLYTEGVHRGVSNVYRSILTSGVEIEELIVYRGVLISWGWNKDITLTVYRGVLILGGLEHCIQRCPHFRGWNRGVPLYTEVPSFQGFLPLYFISEILIIFTQH